MRRRTLLTTAFLGLPALALADDAKEQPLLPPAKLSLSIAIPVRHDYRWLRFSDHFHVLLTNGSKAAVRLWTDRCSWGYENLSFEIKGEDGRTIPVHKKPKQWLRNAPDWLTLAPGESHIIDVDFFSEESARVWENRPTLERRANPSPATIAMRAVYEITPDEQSRRHDIWIGKLETPFETYRL